MPRENGPFLPCAILSHEPKVKMRYEIKIRSTRFNANAGNNVLRGKIFFKITGKEVMDFYFNKGKLPFKDIRFLTRKEWLC